LFSTQYAVVPLFSTQYAVVPLFSTQYAVVPLFSTQYAVVPLFSTQYEKENTDSFLNSNYIIFEGLMEDWLKCHSLVKYPQKTTKTNAELEKELINHSKKVFKV